MKFFLILLLVGTISSLVLAEADGENEGDYCDLSFDQKVKIETCLEKFYTEEEKQIIHKYANCLGYDSMAEFYDLFCNQTDFQEIKVFVDNCKNIIAEISTHVPREQYLSCYKVATSD